MKLGLLLPLFSGDPRRVCEAAIEAEELGFDGGFAFDHLFPPWADVARPSVEVFTTLSLVAEATTKLALGTLVARVTIRSPAMLAKQAAAVDQISGGRMILALGTGDAGRDPEAETFGFPSPSASERRELLEETVEACRNLFRGEPWPGGNLVSPMQGPLAPATVARGGPPIWVGGTAPATVRLAARVADAWNGWGLDLEGFRDRVGRLRTAGAQAGRDVPPTWAGIALVGRDDDELSRLAIEREERGAPGRGVWQGTSEGFGAHLRAIAETGATWAIVMAAGPADRASVIVEAAREAGVVRT